MAWHRTDNPVPELIRKGKNQLYEKWKYHEVLKSTKIVERRKWNETNQNTKVYMYLYIKIQSICISIHDEQNLLSAKSNLQTTHLG